MLIYNKASRDLILDFCHVAYTLVLPQTLPHSINMPQGDADSTKTTKDAVNGYESDGYIYCPVADESVSSIYGTSPPAAPPQDLSLQRYRLIRFESNNTCSTVPFQNSHNKNEEEIILAAQKHMARQLEAFDKAFKGVDLDQHGS